MPRAKRSYKRKRPHRRRKSRKRLRCTIPYTTVAKLRYCTVKEVSFGDVAISTDYMFSANGCYDPDVSGAGHQPRGFDQFMAMYDHYTVIGSKIRVTATNTSDVLASTPICVALVQTDNNSSLGGLTWEDIMERGDISKATLGHPEGDNSVVHVSRGFATKKFFHRGINDDTLRGSNIANPSEGAFFHIVPAIASVLGVGNARHVTLQITVDYIVKFTEPKQPPVS